MSKPTVSVVLGGGHSIGVPMESLSIPHRKSLKYQGSEAILKALSFNSSRALYFFLVFGTITHRLNLFIHKRLLSVIFCKILL